MNTAYWCVLAVILMPYLWGLVATLPSFTFEGNLRPRITAESYTGFQQRAQPGPDAEVGIDLILRVGDDGERDMAVMAL